MGTHLVILDPGHGGDAVAGNSTPTGDVGPGRVEEKAICLAVAAAARQQLELRALRAELTRADDRNLTLRERAQHAARSSASVFVSVHASAGRGDCRGAQAWLHDNDQPGPVELADALLRALSAVGGAGPSRGVQRGPIAVLTPAAHAPGTAALQLELDCLSNADAAAWLASAGTQEALGAAIAGAIASHLEAVRPEQPAATDLAPVEGSGTGPTEEATPKPVTTPSVTEVAPPEAPLPPAGEATSPRVRPMSVGMNLVEVRR